MELMPRPGAPGQPLNVVPMALALVVAAFLGAALGMLIESDGDEEATTAPATEAQAAG